MNYPKWIIFKNNINRVVFYLFFLFLFKDAISVSAQSPKIDSMKRMLPTITGAVERFDLLQGLAVEYFKIDKDTSLRYINKIIDLIPTIHDSARIVKAHRSRAYVLFHFDRYNEVLLSLSQGLSIARRNRIDEEMTIMLNIEGTVYTYIGEYGKALKSLLEAITLRQSLSKGLDLDLLYNNVGLVYYKLRNNEMALSYYQKALQLRRANNKWLYPEMLYINIGLCYCELGDYDSAIYYINQGLGKCVTRCGYIRASGQFALGLTKFRMGEYASSEFHLDSSLIVSRKRNDARYITENLVYLARIYLQTGRFNHAKKALIESESMAMQHGYNELLLDTYRVYIGFFKRKRDYYNLSRHYETYRALREKLYGKELLQSMGAFQVDLEHHDNLKTISRQKNIMGLHNDALVRQRLLYYGLASVILLLAVVIIIVYRQGIYRRKVNKLLVKRISERTLELQKNHQKLEHTQKRLVHLTSSLYMDISSRLMFLTRINSQSNSSNTIGQYKRAVYDTIEQIRKKLEDGVDG